MSTPRRYEITDFEWSKIQPLLPNKPREVPRADDRKVLNGIDWRLRTGSPWADIPERYGPATTCANKFRRWVKIGVWDRVFDGMSQAMTATCRWSIHRNSGFTSTGSMVEGVCRRLPLGTELTLTAWGAREAGWCPRSTPSST